MAGDAALMGMKVHIGIILPVLWTTRDSMATAADTIALVRLRTYAGLDTKDRPFGSYAPYSQKPLYVAFKGARLKPKGGRKTKSGKSMFFQGGYKEYKEKSRRRRTKGGVNQTAEIDLTLSGALMNNLVTTSATKTSFTIGLSGAVKSYGYYVNARRPFIGLSASDRVKVTNAVAARIRKKLS